MVKNNEQLVAEIQKETINSIFEERKQYIIIALTGKVGAGCSFVSSFLKDSKRNFELSRRCPGIDGYGTDSDRIDSVLLRYYRYNRADFHLIRVRDVITSFILEGNAWGRLTKGRSDATQHIVDGIQERFRKAIKLKISEVNKKLQENAQNHHVTNENDRQSLADKNTELENRFKMLNSILSDINNGKELKEILDAPNGMLRDFSEQNINAQISVPVYEYITLILPMLSECVREELGNDYTFIFQDLGNDLRIFGTLDSKKIIADDSFLFGIQKTDRNIIQSEKGKMFTLAERINCMIKYLRRPNNAKRPTAVVIDSMKNKYESNYLRDRYSAYYLFAVSRDESSRIQHLLHDTRKGLSQDDIDVIDFNERPGEVAKKTGAFIKCLHEDIKSILHCREAADDLLILEEYLGFLESQDFRGLFRWHLQKDKSKDRIHRTQVKSILQKETIQELIRDSWSNDGNSLKDPYKLVGLTSTMCKYYSRILDDPLRILLYLNKLYSFFLQDVETCIQNADIFLTNNEPDNGPKYHLKENLYRYISLMMHPGLLTPTPVERCMQIAFTAKANSGCISRQVGAVVTDSEYNILSLGWNDVPCGQTSCIYRNLVELRRQNDPSAYSDYEWNKDSPFHRYLQQYNFENPEVLYDSLLGLPASFCFKTLNEDVTGDKNPMDARSMHGEEKALLQCDQQRVKGGYLFTTSSPCEMCAKNAKEHQISIIYYIEPYPGISQSHVCNSGLKGNQAKFVLFEGAIGRAYTQLYTPVLPYKDELTLRGFPKRFVQSPETLPDKDKTNDDARSSANNKISSWFLRHFHVD